MTALALLAGIGCGTADAQDRKDDTAIRGGRTIAVTMCGACHAITRAQAASAPPVLGQGIPSFEDIANRPDATADSLSDAMKNKRWHDPAFASALLPMSRLSDAQRAQAGAFIMSLRARP